MRKLKGYRKFNEAETNFYPEEQAWADLTDTTDERFEVKRQIVYYDHGIENVSYDKNHSLEKLPIVRYTFTIHIDNEQTWDSVFDKPYEATIHDIGTLISQYEKIVDVLKDIQIAEHRTKEEYPDCQIHIVFGRPAKDVQKITVSFMHGKVIPLEHYDRK